MQGFPSYSSMQLALRPGMLVLQTRGYSQEVRHGARAACRGLTSLCRSLLWGTIYSQSSMASPKLYSPAACFSFSSSASFFSDVGTEYSTCEDPGTIVAVNNNHQHSNERQRIGISGFCSLGVLGVLQVFFRCANKE